MKILVVKGLEMMLDDDVYEKVKGYRWCLSDGKHAMRRFKTRIGMVTFPLAWAVIGVPPIGLTVDHADRNPSNNQRSNLRFATKQQQMENQVRRNKSGFKGVSFNARSRLRKPWQARIGLNGKLFHLGQYPTAEAASDAYFEAAKKLFGEYASK